MTPEEIRSEALLEAGRRVVEKATTPYEAEHLLSSPCLWCGYNGPGYWQQDTHAENCPWHTVGGLGERVHVFIHFEPRAL
jgi:hypothetical protein